MRLPIPLFAFLIAACGPDDEARPTSPIVRDSAGVRIVENGALDSTVAFSVGEPLYRLGDEPGEYEFVRIRDGALRSDGIAAVGDAGHDEVLVVDRTGAVRWTAGGTGEGPGEFSSLAGVGWQADTVLAHDALQSRVAYLVDGEVSSAERLPDAMTVVVANWLGDGRIVVSPGSYRPYSEDPWITMPLVGHDLGSSEVDTLVVYDMAQGLSENETADPFRSFGTIAVRDARIAYGRGDRAEIRVAGADGRLEEIWRWPHPRTPVSDAVWDGYVARRMADPGSRTEAEMEQYLAVLREAVEGELPAFDALYVDAAGRVWTRDYDPTTRPSTHFHVFGPDGGWLGRVELPERTEILDIGENLLLAIRRDELDVQSLVLHPLTLR